MTLPGTNAFLLAVSPATNVDAYGDATPGAASWTGRIPSYWQRIQRTDDTHDLEHLRHTDILIAYVAEGAPTTEVPGPSWTASTILLEDIDGHHTRFTVAGMERRGENTPADSIRLELTNEQPEA